MLYISKGFRLLQDNFLTLRIAKGYYHYNLFTQHFQNDGIKYLQFQFFYS